MYRLASCYFCGTALDESLGEFAVVPRELEPDEQRRVVLCRGCREKLSPVIEHVAEAAMSAGAAAADPTPDRVDDASGSVEDDSADEFEPAQVDSQPETEPPDDQPAPDAAAGASPESASESDAAGDTDTAESAGSEAAETSASEPADGGSEATDGAAETEANTGDGPSLSKLEYNKVMRLLENREFPVDRAEFRTVATNAYEISRDEFQAVIGAAIKKGLLEETEDGQLVRGENA